MGPIISKGAALLLLLLLFANIDAVPVSEASLRAAAEEGDAAAQYDLGVMYAHGQGADQNHKKACKWYKRAAEQEHALAHQRLGIMYREGQGVKQNSKKAIAHLKRSLEQGNSNAQKSLTVTYAKEAREGDAESQNILGSMYYHGKGVKQSYEQAFDWFQMAAEQGHAGAQYQAAAAREKKPGRHSWQYWKTPLCSAMTLVAGVSSGSKQRSAVQVCMCTWVVGWMYV